MTPWVFRLLVANLAVFVLIPVGSPLWQAMGLHPASAVLRPWTIVSYMFLHGGMGHLFFNMLSLFFFGPRLEALLGGRDFLRLYLWSGLGGALLSFVFSPNALIVGASGAIYGILLAFAMIWPREPIYLWGVLPVEARWLALFMAASSLYSGFSGAQGNVAHFAHLGGFAGGFLYLRWRRRRRNPAGGFGNPVGSGFGGRGAARRAPAVPRPLPAPAPAPSAPSNASVEAWRSIRTEGLHELNREEVERLQVKLERSGGRSLTPDEQAFLERIARASGSL